MRSVGALYTKQRCEFTVWAPEKSSMTLHIVYPDDIRLTMSKDAMGYFSIVLNDIKPGTKYFYSPDGKDDFPDPASFYQPEGVHAPSMVVDHSAFQWNPLGRSFVPINDYILYEIHVGTFTPEGTFDAIIPRLGDLKELGITAIELMPVAQFPGARNWGYDGALPYAVQNSYGGPDKLKKLVNACHENGIAVVLDVVYNHFGPEGNYFDKFGPYFTETYKMPWGKAINYDGAWCDGVRNYICNNILYWMEYFHIDGLRLDAVHTIYDFGAVHFWEFVQDELAKAKQRLCVPFYLLAENDANSPKAIQHPHIGGFGFDAQWLDDFHHALYVLLDRKGLRLYEDFGRMDQFAKAVTDGFVHSGEYVNFRKKKHGASSAGVPGNRFVVFNQNHDQIGNRGDGARLSTLVNFDLLKVAAAAMLLSPYIPMLFMGEEYADPSPFYFFVSHSDPTLIDQVNEGRKKDFQRLKWEGDIPPEPQSQEAFNKSKIRWDIQSKGKHKLLLDWTRALIRLRSRPALKNFLKNEIRLHVLNNEGFIIHRRDDRQAQHILAFFNLSEKSLHAVVPDYCKSWKKIIDSTEQCWNEYDVCPKNSLRIDEKREIILDPQSVVAYEGLSSR